MSTRLPITEAMSTSRQREVARAKACLEWVDHAVFETRHGDDGFDGGARWIKTAHGTIEERSIWVFVE